MPGIGSRNHDPRMLGQKTARVAGHHEIPIRRQERARRKSEAHGIRQAPAAEIHRVPGAVVELEPFLGAGLIRLPRNLGHPVAAHIDSGRQEEVRRGVRPRLMEFHGEGVASQHEQVGGDPDRGRDVDLPDVGDRLGEVGHQGGGKVLAKHLDPVEIENRPIVDHRREEQAERAVDAGKGELGPKIRGGAAGGGHLGPHRNGRLNRNEPEGGGPGAPRGIIIARPFPGGFRLGSRVQISPGGIEGKKQGVGGRGRQGGLRVDGRGMVKDLVDHNLVMQIKQVRRTRCQGRRSQPRAPGVPREPGAGGLPRQDGVDQEAAVG